VPEKSLFYTRKEVSRLSGLSESRLSQMASNDPQIGPPCGVLEGTSAVRYPRIPTDNWMSELVVGKSSRGGRRAKKGRKTKAQTVADRRAFQKGAE